MNHPAGRIPIGEADVNKDVIGGVGNAAEANRRHGVDGSGALAADHPVQQTFVARPLVKAVAREMIGPVRGCGRRLAAVVFQRGF